MAWPQEYRSETYCLMKLTTRPWCLDFTLHGHSFHDLSDGFFPFFITRIRRLWSFIHDRVSSKIVYRTKEDRSMRLEIYVLKERKCFSKLEIEKRGWYESLGRKNGKQARSIEPISFVLLSFEEDIHAKKGGEPREREWVGKERDVKNERERRRNRTLIALALISSSLTDNSAPSFIVERSHVRFRLARNPNRISLLF